MNRSLDPQWLRPAASGGANAPIVSGVGASLPHESAHLHVAGAAPYIDDLPELAGTLHAALGLSPVAHGRLVAIDRARIAALPGVVAVLVAADIPGPNDCGPVVHDDPILADGVVHYLGQPVFAVIAQTRDQARRAAAQAKAVLTIEPLAPILTPVEAHAAKSYVLPPMRRHSTWTWCDCRPRHFATRCCISLGCCVEQWTSMPRSSRGTAYEIWPSR